MMNKKRKRQLAAVMFADIQGYTALMQADETRAVSIRERHRKVFQEQHQNYKGRIVQYYGDGALSVFPSALEAVKCAIEIQKLLQTGEIVPVRIGLHMGDIIFDETEVYGDGVNFASRIENMSVPGAILLSGKLNDELKNHPDIKTSLLGFFELKNISEPVEIYAVVNSGITIPELSELKGKQKSVEKTIAVLPFVNISASQENEYFSDGITEEIINALAKIKNLKVTSRTSSFFFKNKNIPITQIGEELGVSVILEGSVRLAGNMIRITAQLIQAKDDFHFWSESWDRKMENIFEIQDEVSLQIADKLREQFGHLEIQEHLVNKQTNSIDAYNFSLKAKFHKNRWNPEDVRTAISLYEKALQLDPNHAESLLGLADSYSFLATTGFISFEEGWGKTAELTNKALLLNDQLAEAHYQLANLAFFTACDYRKSFKEATIAIEIKPNYVDAQHYLSYQNIIAGNIKKSLEHLEIAESIDPLSHETPFYRAYYYYMLEEYSKCLEILNKCLEVNPKNIPAHTVKCYCLIKLERYDEVIHYFDDLPKDIVVRGEKTGITTLAYAHKKDSINTAKYYNLLLEEAKGPDAFRADSYLFLFYSATGENDKAFAWVKAAIEKSAPLLLIHFVDPLVDSIKDDPRYAEYMKIIFGTENGNEKNKGKKKLLGKKDADKYSNILLKYIQEEKPFLDPNLSLRSLAGKINIHPNQLSWLLNENFGKNFNEFINYYRVETFKNLASDPKNSNVTIVGLAYESGFNSKTVFNTYFKKVTGLTPKQYLKEE